MKKILLLFILSSSTMFGQSKLDELLEKWNKRSVPYISVKELAMSKTKAILLDAREEKEYKVSHLENALFVGYENFNLKKTIKKLPNKNAKIVVYCSLGVRSEDVAEKLKKAGYSNVYNLYGGIFEWKNNGNKVFNSEEKETEKVHAFSKEWSKWLLKGEKVYE